MGQYTAGSFSSSHLMSISIFFIKPSKAVEGDKSIPAILPPCCKLNIDRVCLGTNLKLDAAVLNTVLPEIKSRTVLPSLLQNRSIFFKACFSAPVNMGENGFTTVFFFKQSILYLVKSRFLCPDNYNTTLLEEDGEITKIAA